MAHWVIESIASGDLKPKTAISFVCEMLIKLEAGKPITLDEHKAIKAISEEWE